MKKKYLIIAAAIVFVLTIVVLAIRNNNDDQSNTAEQPQSVVDESDALRKGDASRLFDKAEEFKINNADALPDGWSGGILTGENEVEVELSYYQTVWVVSGSQSAVSKDEIRLVRQASCGKNGAASSDSKLSVAVQYRLSTGSVCIDK